MKIPKTIGGIADLLSRVRDERREAQKKVDALRAKENEVREAALRELNRLRLDQARGKNATITKVMREVPRVDDWNRVYDFVQEHKAYDLFERRIARMAWRERVEIDGQIPGIEPETVLDLHVLTRRASK